MKKKYGGLIAVVSIVVLALLTFPMWRYGFGPTPRDNAQKAVCLNQRRQIDAAENQWAEKNRKTTNDVPTWEDIRPFLDDHPNPYGTGYPEIMKCPAGGTHTLVRVGQMPTCSIPGHNLPE
jgi:hypothetical protein